jgi:hypothetical protein
MIKSKRSGSVCCTIDVVSNIAATIYVDKSFLASQARVTELMLRKEKSFVHMGTLFK